MYLNNLSDSIHYEVYGQENAPAVIFTHGCGLKGEMFKAQVAALKDQYRVIIWDMPGHGRSAPLAENLNMPGTADCLIAIMDDLDIDQAVLVGQSLGTYVNQIVALEYPERVTALVSIGGLPIDKPMSRLELATWRILMAVSRIIPEKFLFKRTANEKATTEEAKEFFADSLQQMGKEQFLFALAGQLDVCAMDFNKSPGQSLLIVHGEHEMPQYLVDANKEWHANVPGSHYYEVPGAGHNANQDNPEDFNRALIEFLSGVISKKSRQDEVNV